MDNPDLERQIKLYGLLLDQFHKYTPIFWQAPLALMAANALALDRLKDQPWILLAFGVFDAAFIFALRKLVLRQRSLITAAQNAEKILSVAPLADFLPKFRTYRLRAPDVLLATLLLLDLVLLTWAVAQIINSRSS